MAATSVGALVAASLLAGQCPKCFGYFDLVDSPAYGLVVEQHRVPLRSGRHGEFVSCDGSRHVDVDRQRQLYADPALLAEHDARVASYLANVSDNNQWLSAASAEGAK